MCKIMLMTGHDSAKLSEIIEKSWAAFAATEKDGYGAAWVSPSGKISSAKSSRPGLMDDELPDFCSGFYSSDSLESDGGALLLHGRTATCGVCLDNTHPMLGSNCAVVHNGVVSSRTFHNVDTTCDSELILLAHRQGGATKVASELSGYYAYGFMSVGKNGRTTLDVVRDDKASLYAGKTEHGWVFATTKELLRVVGATPVAPFAENTAARWVNGKHTGTMSIKPQAPDMSLQSKAERALGRFARGQSALPLDNAYPTTNWRMHD